MNCPCWPWSRPIIYQETDLPPMTKPIVTPTPANTPTNQNMRIIEVVQTRFTFLVIK